MKKSSLLLLASALLLTTGCETSSNVSSNDTSSVSAARKSTFSSYWLADVTISSSSLNISYQLDYSLNHVFYISSNDGSILYVRKNSGGVASICLNEHNEVVSEDVLGKNFDSRFANPFSTWEFGQELTSDDKSKLMSILFEEVCPLKGSLSSFSVSSNSITFEVNAAGDKYLVKSDISASSEEKANANISPIGESQASKALDAKLSKLKEGNFTLKVSENGKEVKTILSLSDRMLVDGTTGYLKDESGYKILNVSGGKVTQKSVSNDTYTSLTADFDVSGAIFEGNKLNSLADPTLIAPHFSLKEINGYLENKLFSSIDSSGEDFSISFAYLNSNVTLDFSSIGSTTLPVDLTKITVEKTWKNQYPEIAILGEEYYGDDFSSLPYFFSISKWIVDSKSATKKTINLKLECDKDSGEISTSFITAYISKVTKAGFAWYTSDQIKALDAYSIGGDGDSENDHFFECGKILVEVYDATNDQYVEENAVYIWLSPLGE